MTVLKESETIISGALRDGRQLTRKEIAQILKLAGIEAAGLQLGNILMSAEYRRGRSEVVHDLDFPRPVEVYRQSVAAPAAARGHHRPGEVPGENR